MYLCRKIYASLDRNRDEFTGYLTDKQIQRRLGRILRPYGIRVHTLADSNGYAVSGYFNTRRNTRNVHITVHVDSTTQGIDFDRSRKGWRHFRFIVGQVAQHELVHKIQWRDRCAKEKQVDRYYVTATEKRWKQKTMDYLSDFDEIDAHAHDIALEIRYRYPDRNPYDIVRNIMRYKKLKTLNLYKRIFKDCADWDQTKTRLLKRVWRWLPQVSV